MSFLIYFSPLSLSSFGSELFNLSFFTDLHKVIDINSNCKRVICSEYNYWIPSRSFCLKTVTIPEILLLMLCLILKVCCCQTHEICPSLQLLLLKPTFQGEIRNILCFTPSSRPHITHDMAQ